MLWFYSECSAILLFRRLIISQGPVSSLASQNDLAKKPCVSLCWNGFRGSFVAVLVEEIACGV